MTLARAFLLLQIDAPRVLLQIVSHFGAVNRLSNQAVPLLSDTQQRGRVCAKDFLFPADPFGKILFLFDIAGRMQLQEGVHRYSQLSSAQAADFLKTKTFSPRVKLYLIESSACAVISRYRTNPALAILSRKSRP